MTPSVKNGSGYQARGKARAACDSDDESVEAIEKTYRNPKPKSEELSLARQTCQDLYGGYCAEDKNGVKRLKDGLCLTKQNKMSVRSFVERVGRTRGLEWLATTWVRKWLKDHCKVRVGRRKERLITKTHKGTGVKSVYIQKALNFSDDGLSSDGSDSGDDGGIGHAQTPSTSTGPRKALVKQGKQSEQPASAVKPPPTASDDDFIGDVLSKTLDDRDFEGSGPEDDPKDDPKDDLPIGTYVMVGLAGQPDNASENAYAAVGMVIGNTPGVSVSVFPSGKQVVVAGTCVVHLIRVIDSKAMCGVIVSDSFHATAHTKDNLTGKQFRSVEEAKKATDNPSGVRLVFGKEVLYVCDKSIEIQERALERTQRAASKASEKARSASKQRDSEGGDDGEDGSSASRLKPKTAGGGGRKKREKPDGEKPAESEGVGAKRTRMPTERNRFAGQ